MKKFLNEFKEFAVKGNAIDMAIGVVIGAAFGKVVTAIIDIFLNPLLEALPILRIPVCVLLLCALVFLCRYCLTQQRAVLEPAFNTGLLEAVSSLEEGDEPVWITNNVNMPYVYVLFARGTTPEEFQADLVYADPDAPFRRVTRFSRWRFGSVLPEAGLCILPLSEARKYEEDGYLRIRAAFGLYAVAEAGDF